MRIAVAVSGGGSNLQALLDALPAGAPARIALVVSNTPKAGGLARAAARGVSTLVLEDPADGAEWLRHLTAHGIDLVVLAGYLKLVPSTVIAAYRGRILNIHPALLPAFGGSGMYGTRVHQAVLDAGLTETGCIVHLVDEEYDRGEILAQARVPVLRGESVESLAARVLEAEHELLPRVVLAIAAAGHSVPLADRPTA